MKRSLLVPILASHDVADTDELPRALYDHRADPGPGLLNGEFTNDQAALLADRLRREAPDDLAGQVSSRIWLRPARARGREVRDDVAFLKKLTAESARRADGADSYCLMVLNVNEFLYLD